MDFRRSGQLDERRRRVLMDEIASPSEPDSPAAASAAGGSVKGPVRAYSPAVLNERQPKVTDLLPVRPLLVLLVILLGLTGIAAIEAIHFHVFTRPLNEGAAQLAALDVRQRGSLAAWYSSALLAAAAVLALVIFSIRSHRVDDYRGRYRIWLWTTAALAWLSLDAATAIHDALGLGITLLASRQVLGGPLATGCTITWLAVYGLVLGTLGIRLAMEVWPSLASFSSLAASGLLYLVSGLMQLDMLSPASPLTAAIAESTITMLAHLSLAMAIGFYARHVYLDATGRLKVHIDPDRKKSKLRARPKAIREDKSGGHGENGAEQPAARPAAATVKPNEPIKFGSVGDSGSASSRSSAGISKATLSSPHYDDDSDEDENDYGGERLSKSERRRLKKLARREQQRRAA